MSRQISLWYDDNEDGEDMYTMMEDALNMIHQRCRSPKYMICFIIRKSNLSTTEHWIPALGGRREIRSYNEYKAIAVPHREIVGIMKLPKSRSKEYINNSHDQFISSLFINYFDSNNQNRNMNFEEFMSSYYFHFTCCSRYKDIMTNGLRSDSQAIIDRPPEDSSIGYYDNYKCDDISEYFYDSDEDEDEDNSYKPGYMSNSEDELEEDEDEEDEEDEDENLNLRVEQIINKLDNDNTLYIVAYGDRNGTITKALTEALRYKEYGSIIQVHVYNYNDDPCNLEDDYVKKIRVIRADFFEQTEVLSNTLLYVDLNQFENYEDDDVEKSVQEFYKGKMESPENLIVTVETENVSREFTASITSCGFQLMHEECEDECPNSTYIKYKYEDESEGEGEDMEYEDMEYDDYY